MKLNISHYNRFVLKPLISIERDIGDNLIASLYFFSLDLVAIKSPIKLIANFKRRFVTIVNSYDTLNKNQRRKYYWNTSECLISLRDPIFR